MLTVWLGLLVAGVAAQTGSGGSNSTVRNTLFNQDDFISSANVPALFAVAVAVFAIVSTVFFLIHRASEEPRTTLSARDAALG